MTDQTTSDRLLRRPEVESRTGLSKASLYRFMGEGTFPSPVKIGYRAVAWPQSLIDEWIEHRKTGNTPLIAEVNSKHQT